MLKAEVAQVAEMIAQAVEASEKKLTDQFNKEIAALKVKPKAEEPKKK